jgi:hypothetical protein
VKIDFATIEPFLLLWYIMVAKVEERTGWFDLTAENVPDLLIGRLGTRGLDF